MRFFLVVLGLSALVVAGPLPSLSKNALEARAQPLTLNNQAPGLKARSSDSISTSANITLGPDVVMALNDLKMIYNNLVTAEHNSTLIQKRDFWVELEDKLAEEGLWPRSSTVANCTISPEFIAALTEYDSRNEKRMESDLTKRDWLTHWFKMMFDAPGLKARSSDSISTAANSTVDLDSIAALITLKAKYDSLNQKRAEKDLTKRDWLTHWFKMMFDAPGLKARSAIPTSTPADITMDADSAAALTKVDAVHDSLNEKRTDSGVVVKRGLFSFLKKMYGTPPNVQISSR